MEKERLLASFFCTISRKILTRNFEIVRPLSLYIQTSRRSLSVPGQYNWQLEDFPSQPAKFYENVLTLMVLNKQVLVLRCERKK